MAALKLELACFCGSLSARKPKEEPGLLRMLDERIRRDCLKSFIELAIIARLRNNPMNGYEITIRLMKELDVIVSPSVVYAALNSLERDGQAVSKKQRRGRVYELTQNGRSTAEKIPDEIAVIQSFLKVLLRY